ncbi:hypothetical protein [Secundilactobacillus kimchicus]|uniref:hypothetical protein n=1 Tax=Secundilactobacillus kimchicus TaxID=528209 RepID=UPI0024A9E9F3|nr:hypothetical protein [Secundilactobacillus kimchicus]
MNYYVKPDSKLNNEFPDKGTAPALEPADGLQEVDVPATSVQYFTRYWWQYRLLGNGRVQAPGNLPNLDIDYLQGIVDQQADKLDQALSIVDSQAATIKQLQDMAVESAKARAADATTIKQLKEMAVAMTKQLAAFQKSTTETTTNTKEGGK